MTAQLDEAIEALAFAVSLVPLGDNLNAIHNTLDVVDRAVLEAKFALDAALSRQRRDYSDYIFATHPQHTQSHVVTLRAPPTLDDLAL